MVLPPSNRVEGDPNHTPDHNSIVTEVAALITKTTTPVTFTATAAADVPFTAKGATNQTGDLQRWVNSGGTALAGVDANGEVRSGQNSTGIVSMFKTICRAATSRGYTVRGASSQSANLFEGQDSTNAVVFSVGPTGTVTAPNVGVKLIVLDNAASVPAGTPTGTVILRRPA